MIIICIAKRNQSNLLCVIHIYFLARGHTASVEFTNGDSVGQCCFCLRKDLADGLDGSVKHGLYHVNSCEREVGGGR